MDWATDSPFVLSRQLARGPHVLCDTDNPVKGKGKVYHTHEECRRDVYLPSLGREPQVG